MLQTTTQVPALVPRIGHITAKIVVDKTQEARTIGSSLPGSKTPQSLRPRPIDNVVNNAVFLGLCGRHDEVALHITLDPLKRLARAGAH
jgi:hypothetical protein